MPLLKTSMPMIVAEEVQLKDVDEFKIIGTSRKNEDGKKIVTGRPLFGLEYSMFRKRSVS